MYNIFKAVFTSLKRFKSSNLFRVFLQTWKAAVPPSRAVPVLGTPVADAQVRPHQQEVGLAQGRHINCFSQPGINTRRECEKGTFLMTNSIHFEGSLSSLTRTCFC
jgi:hypothetical protein